MMKLRKRQLAGVVCLAMMMGLTACGKTADDTSGQEVTTEIVTESVEVENDAMDIHSEDNAEFYAIRIKDEYYEIYQEGDYVGFRNLYLDQQGTYPPLEEGKVGKVIADVDIYNGGEGGYSNEKFIKEINEFEEISYSKFVSAFDICQMPFIILSILSLSTRKWKIYTFYSQMAIMQLFIRMASALWSTIMRTIRVRNTLWSSLSI